MSAAGEAGERTPARPSRSRRGSIAISMRGVSVPGGRGRRSGTALEGVSLDVCEGQLTAVVGTPAGSPSRLIGLAAGIEQPGAGAILTGGSIHRGLGDPRASQLRTGEAIMISRASRPSRIRAGLGRRSPAGGADAAAARRQLAAIERAIAADPLVLFADLDAPGERACIEAIAGWVSGRGRTALASVADPLAAVGADRVLVISHGAIVADLEDPDRGELEQVSLLSGG